MKKYSTSDAGINPHIKTRMVYCFAALLVFIGGVAIYLFFRDTGSLVLFNFLPRPLFLESLSVSFRPQTMPGYLFIYNLPHGLWCLSGLMVIRAIWLEDIKWRAIYGGTFLVIISVLEISQISQARNGTFDVLDIVFYVFFAFVESMIYIKFIRRGIL